MNYSEVAVAYMLDKAKSHRSAAMTSLTILLNHPSWIGDHSIQDLHNNLDEALSKLADADDRIETIQKYFLNKPE